MSKINVCFICDEKYVLTTMVAIKSLIENSGKKTFCNIYVVATNLNEDSIKNFKKLSTKKCKIYVKETNNIYDNIDAKHLYVSKAALLKFNLSNMFPKLNKILYLDGDILVFSDLSELYNTPLKDKYAAVVADILDVDGGHNKRLGLTNYFNSGVMLLNISKMRKDKISEKLLDYKLHKCEGIFMDQDSFNAVFNEKIEYISLKYNMLLAYRNIEIKKISDFYNIKNIEEVINKPVILHMAGYKDKLSLSDDIPESMLLKEYYKTLNNVINSTKTKRNFLFNKEYCQNGRVHIYICGIKVASYSKNKIK